MTITTEPRPLETRPLATALLNWQDQQAERGGRALAAVLQALPVMRGAQMDPAIPARWRARLELLAQSFERALGTGR